jgi:hypothetical protein
MDKDLKPAQTLTTSHIPTSANTCKLRMTGTNLIICSSLSKICGSLSASKIQSANAHNFRFNSVVKESTCKPKVGSTTPKRAHSKARTEGTMKKHNGKTQKQEANTWEKNRQE